MANFSSSSISIASTAGALLALASKNASGIVTSPTLDRPVASLADNIQKATSAFFSIQQDLLSHDHNHKKIPKLFREQFTQGKQLFRAQCESLRQTIQTAHRHAADYAASSQRAPDDRAISAKRCFLSAKGVCRDVQEVGRVYETTMSDFKKLRPTLNAFLDDPQNRSSNNPALIVTPGSNGGGHVVGLYTALENIQISLRDLVAFWEHHVGFLALLVNRQTNYPSPGEEAKAVWEIWAGRYKEALLEASGKMVEAADVLDKEPVTEVKKRRGFVSLKGVRRGEEDGDVVRVGDVEGGGQVPARRKHSGHGLRDVLDGFFIHVFRK